MMKVKKVTKRNRDFNHEGNFYSSAPLLNPKITSAVLVNKDSDPAVLHTMIKIEAPEGSNEFLYHNEENIEIDSEGKPLDPNELLDEVRNSIKRCYKDAYDACVEGELVFPFPRICPEVDLTATLEKLKEDLA